MIFLKKLAIEKMKDKTKGLTIEKLKSDWSLKCIQSE